MRVGTRHWVVSWLVTWGRNTMILIKTVELVCAPKVNLHVRVKEAEAYLESICKLSLLYTVSALLEPGPARDSASAKSSFLHI